MLRVADSTSLSKAASRESITVSSLTPQPFPVDYKMEGREITYDGSGAVDHHFSHRFWSSTRAARHVGEFALPFVSPCEAFPDFPAALSLQHRQA
ncbi:hypothetical protein BO1005MUT1_240022 [Hyphomicrobiales bacterium]|nr:hypothetical protein BO1005MUT1_240022 [Hyphomicrobiales bacterium]